MGAKRGLVATSVAVALTAARGFMSVPPTAHVPRCPVTRVGGADFARWRSSVHSRPWPRRLQVGIRARGSHTRKGQSKQRCTRSVSMGLGPLAPGAGRKAAMVAMMNAAAFATVGGGALAGGLHAVSGPDHLAALLPRIMGQKWQHSARIGATWGLGHGSSATIIGLVAFFCKDRLGLGQDSKLVSRMGQWTEGLVGVSLIAIGLLGLKDSVLEGGGEEPAATDAGVVAAVPKGGGEEGAVPGAASQRGGRRAIFFNGLLHGFSWDGAPSLAPALSLSSWRSVLWFLLAYCTGTMAAMSATTTVIGEGSVRVGEALQKPDIPRKLSRASSFVAIVIGAVWLIKAAFF